MFEKSKKFLCIPFYEDNKQTLIKLTHEYFRKINVQTSAENINLIVDRANGDRENLMNELEKIEQYINNGKNITKENLLKLVNLTENHSVSELIDNCLAKNQRKIINILNENNFNNEDCILIIRTFLNKSKRILKLSNEYQANNNIDYIISSAKPPIFWKDKEITKQQIFKWTPKNIKSLIYKLSEIELIIKKNVNISINIITDFILEQSSTKTNN
mgnify:CR=1 FL=1